MAEKKSRKVKTTKSKTTSKAKTSKTKKKKIEDLPSEDSGLVIVEDDIVIDQEKVNEERRAYLEESRSQDSSD
jgi:hypothetical protein